MKQREIFSKSVNSSVGNVHHWAEQKLTDDAWRRGFLRGLEHAREEIQIDFSKLKLPQSRKK